MNPGRKLTPTEVQRTHPGFYIVDIFDCQPFQMFSVGDDPRAYDILEDRHFEPHSMRLWCLYAKSATCIVDIGAHTGVYALAAASLRKDISIHAFEPNPYTAARLRLHRQINGFNNLVDHAFALTEVQGITEIGWPKPKADTLASGTRLSEFPAGIKPNKAAVYTAPLDAFSLSPGNSALVKIDVEGAELNVLRGMSVFLQSRPTILIESFEQPKCDAITAMLPNYNFFAIDECGTLIPQSKLIAASPTADNRNQLCLPAKYSIPL